jgi:hypothetical protein
LFKKDGGRTQISSVGRNLLYEIHPWFLPLIAFQLQLSASGFGNDIFDDFIIVGGSLDPLPAGEHQHVILKIPGKFLSTTFTV